MSFFFFNDTATTEIYTLSLHDALPISQRLRECAHRLLRLRPRRPPGAEVADRAHDRVVVAEHRADVGVRGPERPRHDRGDRKSTRLNSSHANISYAVFCLKKKKQKKRS